VETAGWMDESGGDVAWTMGEICAGNGSANIWYHELEYGLT
jgi:hypothetical protein